jgi:hypothetical protein
MGKSVGAKLPWVNKSPSGLNNFLRFGKSTIPLRQFCL